MRTPHLDESYNAHEILNSLTIDALKPLAKIAARRLKRGEAVGGKQPLAKKGQLVQCVAALLLDPTQLRALYDDLDDVSKLAVQEAVSDPGGCLLLDRFQAKYGRLPTLGQKLRWGSRNEVTSLDLFFPASFALPEDVRERLEAFIPAPPPLSLTALDELPEMVKRPQVFVSDYWSPDEEEITMRVRPMAAAALHNVKAVFRLVDKGSLRVGEKTLRPSAATMQAVASVLLEGDFYTEADQTKDAWDQASDLVIQPFAWPLLLQAAGLAKASGSRLAITPAGRKIAAQPAHEWIALIWNKWLSTKILDEFNRVEAIKGQSSKGRYGLTQAAERRGCIVEALADFQPEKWYRIEELFRALRASDLDFQVSQNPAKLYLCELRYGSFVYADPYTWEQLEGRFTLAFMMEIAATLGIVDIAYISPLFARNDFRGRWGTDEHTCLSRYDGLMFFRINPLGAYVLGLATSFEPPEKHQESGFRVLANLDVVAKQQPPSPSDVMFIDRFAERAGDLVWKLDRGKILAAIEEGQPLEELLTFLKAQAEEGLPQTVEVFLQDVKERSTQLRDLGHARLIDCGDLHTATMLAHDARLRGQCQISGERHLVFRSADEGSVRKRLRELGYVLPPAN